MPDSSGSEESDEIIQQELQERKQQHYSKTDSTRLGKTKPLSGGSQGAFSTPATNIQTDSSLEIEEVDEEEEEPTYLRKVVFIFDHTYHIIKTHGHFKDSSSRRSAQATKRQPDTDTLSEETSSDIMSDTQVNS